MLEQQGADRPITSSLANLGGAFFTDDYLIASASMGVALPRLVVEGAPQHSVIAEVTIGAKQGEGETTYTSSARTARERGRCARTRSGSGA